MRLLNTMAVPAKIYFSLTLRHISSKKENGGLIYTKNIPNNYRRGFFLVRTHTPMQSRNTDEKVPAAHCNNDNLINSHTQPKSRYPRKPW